MVFIPDIVSQILWWAGVVMAFFALGCAWFVWREGQKRETAEDAATLAAEPWLAFDDGHEWLVYVDRDGTVLNASASFLTATKKQGVVIGQHIAAVLAPHLASTAPLHILDAAMRAGAPARAVLDMNGRQLLMTGHPWRENGANSTLKGYRLLTADITPEHARIGDLQKLAYTDALTGLGNRAWLLHEAAQALHDKSIEALLVFTFPRLATLTANAGQGLGPEQAELFMISAARRLSDAVDARTRIARVGPESFAVVTPWPDYRTLANDYGQALAAPISLPDRDVTIAPAVGISVTAQTSETWLYQAETAARTLTIYNRPLVAEYHATMHDDLSRRRAIASDLRRAVYFAPEQLQCRYQPIYELATRTVAGVELVPAWQHPVWGDVTGADLSVLADAADLAAPLWVALYVRALGDMKRWNATHANLFLHVSLSAQLFVLPNLMTTVDTLSGVTGIAPGQVDLAVTATDNGEQTQDQMLALRARGFGLTLADFGAGHTSLDALRSLPVTGVTIGPSFVGALHTSKPTQQIVNAMVHLGQSLGHRTTGAGIQSAADVATLVDMGCVYGSGPYFGPPLAATGVNALLTA